MSDVQRPKPMGYLNLFRTFDEEYIFSSADNHSTMLRSILAVVFLFSKTTNAFFFTFKQCPGSEQCGLFGFGVLKHSGTLGGDDCAEYCVFLMDSTLECGGCDTETLPTPAPVLPSPTAPVNAPVPSPLVSEYDISMELVGIPSSDESIFSNAQARWEQVVVGELQDVSGITDLEDGCTVPAVIDDLHICAKYGPIDGNGNVLGYSMPYYSRSSNGLPIAGAMQFDSADVESLKTDGNFGALILHEMGHILGIGTRWSGNGVTGPAFRNCPYRGDKANTEFAAISGCSVAVPTETDGGGGTACGHWDEECMGSELMTGYLDEFRNPLSRITVATLEDLGYTVDYSKADNFTRSDLNPNCVCRRRALMDMIHGDTHQLGLRVPGVQRRRLSDEAFNTAMAFGKSILASRKFVSLLGDKSVSPEVTYVAIQVVNVLVADNGRIFDVVVRADSI